MTEKFDSKFHKEYVRGEGEVVEKLSDISSQTRLPDGQVSVASRTYEDVLAEYRWYIRDPEAVLPEEIEKQLELLGVI